VLSVAVAPSPSGAYIGLTGSSDGCIAVWNLSDAAEAHLELDPGSTSRVKTLRPLLELPGAHQSGVNALSLATVPREAGREPLLVAVSAGDDQSLRAQWLEVTEGEAPPGYSGAIALAQSAHSSAVRDVWTDGRLAYSVGLDQCLRAWRLLPPASMTGNVGNRDVSDSPNGTIVLVCCVRVDVMEPCTMSVLAGTRTIESYARRAAAGGRDTDDTSSWQQGAADADHSRQATSASNMKRHSGDNPDTGEMAQHPQQGAQAKLCPDLIWIAGRGLQLIGMRREHD